MGLVGLNQYLSEFTQCHYGSTHSARRPSKSPEFACLGGVLTFGQHMSAPFGKAAQNVLGKRVVNFGIHEAVSDVFFKELSPLKLNQQAKFCLVEVNSTNNFANPFDKIHRSRSD